MLGLKTPVERRGRHLILIKTQSRSSKGIVAGLAESLGPLPSPIGNP